MNGSSQIEQYAALGDWKPDQLAGFRVGDLAEVPTLGRVEIMELMPPSMFKVRTKTGAVAKVGYRVCQRV